MFLPNTAAEVRTMLAEIGVASVDELFAAIPAELKRDKPLDLPPGLTEMELAEQLAGQMSGTVAAADADCFLGGGAYDHFIPAVVDALASDPRFVTAYTPYQAEASQGSLQAFFEYQTLITRLTGMDISNASHYDGATACVEAVLMAVAARSTPKARRSKVIVAGAFSQQYFDVLETVSAYQNIEPVRTTVKDGACDPGELQGLLDDRTACVVVQHPNRYGILEDVEAIANLAHEAGAMLVVCVDPISLGILKRPDAYGADIVVAEGQSLGIPLSFGGPYLGILACRQSLLRRMPGRLVGETLDRRGNRCWVLTMQTREQHIRREKATSNICSNQGLMALRACVYLAALGPAGLREVAELCVRKSHYLAAEIEAKTPLRLAHPDAPFFKEFLLRMPDGAPARPLVDALAEKSIFVGMPCAGIPCEDRLLVAVTEKRTRAQMDHFVAEIAAFFPHATQPRL